jgi:DNA-binding MarR family transcriptional regulator
MTSSMGVVSGDADRAAGASRANDALGREPLREPQPPLGQLIRDVHLALRAAFDEALRPHGVTLRQLGVLAALMRSPGLSNADLARRFHMTPQSMVDLLRGLETTGLVVRRPHPAGGRVLQTELTSAGTAKLLACQAVMHDAEARLLAGVGQRDRLQLRNLLERVLATLRPSPR